MKHEHLASMARWALIQMLGPAMTPMADSRQLVRWARIAQMRGPAMTPRPIAAQIRCSDVCSCGDDAEADRHEERIPGWGRGYKGNTCTYLLEHAKLHD